MFLVTINGDPTIVPDSDVQYLDNTAIEISGSLLIEAARAAYTGGRKITAIKLMRTVISGLKEAKDFCDDHFEVDPRLL